MVQISEQGGENVADVRFDYRKLRGRIKEVCGTQDVYADRIKLGKVSVSQRLNNVLEFSQSEMLRSAEVLGFAPSEIPLYFFVPEVQKDEQ